MNVIRKLFSPFSSGDGRLPAREMVRMAGQLSKRSEFRVCTSLVPYQAPCGESVVRYVGPIMDITPAGFDAFLTILGDEPEKFGNNIPANASDMFIAAMRMMKHFKRKVDLDVTIRGILHQMHAGKYSTEAAIAMEALSLYRGGRPRIDNETLQFFDHCSAYLSEWQLHYLFYNWPYVSADMEIDMVQLAESQEDLGVIRFNEKIAKRLQISYQYPEQLAETMQLMRDMIHHDNAFEKWLHDLEVRRMIRSRFTVLKEPADEYMDSRELDDIRNFPG